MREKFHIKATRADGTIIFETDYACMYGAICCGDGKHIGLNNGCCTGEERITTLKALYDNLASVVKDILEEAPFLQDVIEGILSDDPDSPVCLKREVLKVIDEDD